MTEIPGKNRFVLKKTRAERMIDMCREAGQSSREVDEDSNNGESDCSNPYDDDSIADPTFERSEEEDNEDFTLIELTNVPIDVQDNIPDSVQEGIFMLERVDPLQDDHSVDQTKENTDPTPTIIVKRRQKNIVKRKMLSKDEKSERDQRKHPMKPPCQDTCRQSCRTFSENDRLSLWKNYWSLDYTNRRKWLANNVQLANVKRRTVEINQNSGYKKTCTRIFYLPKNDTSIRVCRLFLLNTLGYSNDSVLTELCCAMKKEPLWAAVKENRGTHEKPKCDRKVIREHIESYHPSAAHYRRHNAPNIRYLSRDLTVRSMYEDFNQKYPGTCKIEIYRQTMKELHVSLCMPISDICDECLSFKMKESEAKSLNDGETESEIVSGWRIHKDKATKATNKYKHDSEIPDDETVRIYSMDLQKVMLIPNMPAIKDSFFTSRLVVFNETFASLKKNSKFKNYRVMWHEGVAGRNAHNIVDSILRVIEEERDVKEFIFWADNCSAQNRNWILLTALVVIVNEEVGPDTITFRYLTKGHTHMSADGVHGNIEKQVAKVRNIYDFADMKNVVERSRKNLSVLDVQTFYNWVKKKRTTRKLDDPLKDLLLKTMVEIRFEKGSRSIKYKTDFDNNYMIVDFLQKKFDIKQRPNKLNANRGIPTNKKKAIMDVLVPLMPPSRQIFWNNLPENDNVVDLNDDTGVTDIAD